MQEIWQSEIRSARHAIDEVTKAAGDAESFIARLYDVSNPEVCVRAGVIFAELERLLKRVHRVDDELGALLTYCRPGI